MSTIVSPYFAKKSEEDSASETITYQIVLESSSEHDSSDEESIFSMQANTTVSAKDTSDISTDESVSEYYMSEFEINSSPGFPHPWTFDRDISSSTTAQDVNIEECHRTNDEYDTITDVSDNVNDDKYPSKLKMEFYQTCAQCFSTNPNPSFRFCEMCYQVRKEFFPSKPKCKKRKNISIGENEMPVKRMKCDAIELVEKLPEINIGNGAATETAASSSQDSGFDSQSQNDDSGLAQEKCLTCLTTVVNGLFVHGRTAHRCCCHKCSKRIWLETKRCPICRRKVSNVIMLLNC